MKFYVIYTVSGKMHCDEYDSMNEAGSAYSNLREKHSLDEDQIAVFEGVRRLRPEDDL